LEKEGLIEMVRREHRRKVYALTAKGKRVLHGQIERLALMTRSGQHVMKQMNEQEGAL